jgi:hypothetical protein
MLRETLFGIVHIGNILEVEKLLNTLGVVIKDRNYILAVLRQDYFVKVNYISVKICKILRLLIPTNPALRKLFLALL